MSMVMIDVIDHICGYGLINGSEPQVVASLSFKHGTRQDLHVGALRSAEAGYRQHIHQ